ncbi:MAG: hypothetical protein Q9215_004772 [Flavoplaca cf. flavocitrina]
MLLYSIRVLHLLLGSSTVLALPLSRLVWTFLSLQRGWSRSLNAPNIQRVYTRSATTERVEVRGTNWDGALSEDAGDHPATGSKKARGTSWDNAPVKDTRDQNFYGSTGSRKRGTNSDNAPAEETTLQGPYGRAVLGRNKRGTAWDNLLGEDNSKALGSKVGQGGEPQPLHGNAWEQGRRLKRFPFNTIESRADGKDIIDGGKPMPAQQGVCITCLLKRWVKRFYPTGSWLVGMDGSQTTSDNQVHVKRTEDSRGNIATDGGKPTPLDVELKPAGACSSCMVRRWVSASYVSARSWFVPMVKDPTSDNDKQHVTRTEDSKGSIGSDGGKASSDGGVPMPLCFSCWWRRVK